MKKKFLSIFIVGLCFILNVSLTFAATTILKVDIDGGSLTLTSPSISTLSATTLENSQRISKGELGEIQIVDNRGSGSGWSVTMTVSDFVCCKDQGKIGVNNLTIVPGNLAALGASKIDGVSAGDKHTFSSLEDIATIAVASSKSGMGSYKINPEVNLNIPADALAGQYSATIVLTII